MEQEKTYIFILNMSILNAILKKLAGNILHDDDHMLLLYAATLLYVLNFTVLLSFSLTTPALQ